MDWWCYRKCPLSTLGGLSEGRASKKGLKFVRAQVPVFVQISLPIRIPGAIEGSLPRGYPGSNPGTSIALTIISSGLRHRPGAAYLSGTQSPSPRLPRGASVSGQFRAHRFRRLGIPSKRSHLAVSGLMIVVTSLTKLAGNPPCLACSLTIASLGAR